MTKLEEVAKAMEERRRELIAQPLNRIWPELAEAAVRALREPPQSFMDQYPPYFVKGDEGWYPPNTVRAAFYRSVINTILSEKEQGK